MKRSFSDWSVFNLFGRNALVTGGAGLLGPEHGAGLARCGATIILVDLTEDALELAHERITAQVPGARVETAVVDITSETSLVNLRSDLEERGLVVDILVNNAAVNPKMDNRSSGPSNAVENYDMRAWNEEIKVGITGTFLCCKVFGHGMAMRGRGVIINIASDLAILAPDQRIYSSTGRIEDVVNFKPIGYVVTKTAMLGINRYLATYWGHRGVRVNCLVPGPVFNNQPDHLVKQIKQRIPLGRWADRNEYQGAVAFLASDASAYMTGQVLVMDGGRSIW